MQEPRLRQRPGDVAQPQEIGRQLVGVQALAARVPLGVAEVTLAEFGGVDVFRGIQKRQVRARAAHTIGAPAHLEAEVAQLAGVGHVVGAGQDAFKQRGARARLAQDEHRRRAVLRLCVGALPVHLHQAVEHGLFLCGIEADLTAARLHAGFQRGPGGAGVAQVVEFLEQRVVQRRRVGVIGRHRSNGGAQAGDVVGVRRGAAQLGQLPVRGAVQGLAGQAGFESGLGFVVVAGVQRRQAQLVMQARAVAAQGAGAFQENPGFGGKTLVLQALADAQLHGRVRRVREGRRLRQRQCGFEFAHLAQQFQHGFQNHRVGFVGVAGQQGLGHAFAQVAIAQRQLRQAQTGRRQPVGIGGQSRVGGAGLLQLAAGAEGLGGLPGGQCVVGGHACSVGQRAARWQSRPWPGVVAQGLAEGLGEGAAAHIRVVAGLAGHATETGFFQPVDVGAAAEGDLALDARPLVVGKSRAQVQFVVGQHPPGHEHRVQLVVGNGEKAGAEEVNVHGVRLQHPVAAVAVAQRAGDGAGGRHRRPAQPRFAAEQDAAQVGKWVGKGFAFGAQDDVAAFPVQAGQVPVEDFAAGHQQQHLAQVGPHLAHPARRLRQAVKHPGTVAEAAGEVVDAGYLAHGASLWDRWGWQYAPT